MTRMSKLFPGLKLAALVAFPVALGACAVGPNYVGPPQAAPRSEAAGHFHREALGDASAAPPPSRWWEALGDPTLNGLVDQALAHSPTVAEAQARLRSARASLGASRAQLAPSGSATAFAARAHIPTAGLRGLGALTGSAAAPSSDVNLYSVGFDAIWELDLFGGRRRGIEAAAAQAGAQEAQLADAQVQLAADVAQAYVDLRAGQAKLQLTQDTVGLNDQLLALVRQRRVRGAAADPDAERALTDVVQARAQLGPLQAQIAADMDQIAMLTGREPGELDATLAGPRPTPQPPRVTPIGDPAALLRRRPDIRAAERKLAAASAQIGRNIAQFFPSVTLFGDLGFAATEPGKVFDVNSLSAIGAPILSWSPLAIPRIQAQVRGARADRDAAAAEYQRVVLAALQDAEGALSRFGGQRQSLGSLAEADASAARARALAQLRYQGGTASLTDVLDTGRQQNAARQALVDGQAGLTRDYIALQKSLGLGWAPPPAPQLASAERPRADR
jgi:multidrug efflux system outer membrane protein